MARTTKEKVMAMADVNVLSDERINELLSLSKQRGLYEAELKAFIESGVRGIEVPLDTGTFAGKKAGSVKTGLDNARKKIEDVDVRNGLKVIKQEEQVFLLNTAA
jgi:hypothetical protein